MEVILKEDVEKLGFAGKKVRVANGYARNYLIPQGLAIEANAANLKIIEQHMKIRAKHLAEQKAKAEAVAEKIAAIRLVFIRKTGEEGKLYGSVTSAEIAKGVLDNNVEIDKRKIVLDMPIKQLGDHKVKIKLHPEVTAEVAVEVQAEAVEEEAIPTPPVEEEKPEEPTAE